MENEYNTMILRHFIQDKLTCGQNIKTIGGECLLGSGNIEVDIILIGEVQTVGIVLDNTEVITPASDGIISVHSTVTGNEPATTKSLACSIFGAFKRVGGVVSEIGSESKDSKSELPVAISQTGRTFLFQSLVALVLLLIGKVILEFMELNNDDHLVTGTKIITYGTTGVEYFVPITGIYTGIVAPVKSNVTISHTGTLVETLKFSQIIPAGTFNANDLFMFNVRFGGTSNANTKDCRVYINSSATLVGATKIAQHQITTGALGYENLKRTMTFKNSLSAQSITNVGANFTNDEIVPCATLSNLTINFAVDQYFLVSLDLANVGDTATVKSIYSKIYR